MAKKGKSKETAAPPATKGKKSGKLKDADKEEEEESAKTKRKSRNKNQKEEEEPNKQPTTDKPQRGLAIGENFGWTGKLPATLMYEHCQKQKWNKVIFDMHKTRRGFIGIVNLSWENPRTKEVIHVKMMPEEEILEPRDTTNEARHFAATYALHRINYIKNMKMLLPIIFRDFWSQMETNRLALLKSDRQKHDEIYNVNPFDVVLKGREKKQQRERELLVKKQNEAKKARPAISIQSTTSYPLPATSKPIASTKSTKPLLSFPRKVWQSAPFIDFPSSTRSTIEKSIRNHISWSSQNTGSDNGGYKHELVRLGFRETHVLESFQYTSTFVDSLEWLIFHVPEDDLPLFFTKSDDQSNVSLKISTDVQRENMIKRLGQSGADYDDIVTALAKNGFDEVQTAIDLTYSLSDYEPDTEDAEPTEDGADLWQQEVEGIQIIASHSIDFVEKTDGRVVTVKLNPKFILGDLLSVNLYRPNFYPLQIPGIQLVVTDTSFKLANYIKISVTREIVKYILENGMIGDCMIYSIIEWLEENISKIIDNPGLLTTTSEAKLLSKEKTSSAQSKGKKKKAARELSDSDVEKLKSLHVSKNRLPEMKKSLEDRAKLPAWAKREQLVKMINSNKVTLVTGETGSGKSTQIVQFILDELNANGNFKSRILCTQPRRISTIGLAERISEERLEKLGEEVGYIIRGENKTKHTTRISFVTTGVLLRMLQSLLASSSGKDEELVFANLDYIFIDEVHERSVDSDFLLIILKRMMKKFPNLKIILMSATISLEIFKTFFNSPVNHIHIEGRTFPIQDYYLEDALSFTNYTITKKDGEEVLARADSAFFTSGTIDYNLIAELCLHIDKKLTSESNTGSILIFLPGVMEINQCIRKIESIFEASGRETWCLPLHSVLSSKDQKRVFKMAPRGVRKIVVSTNVAETSITIADCVAVVDSGRVKTMFYDPQTNAAKLVEDWCSRAEMMQRRGRAGRITNGNCYHLYTKVSELKVLPQPIPKIKRVRLENLYLIVKSMGISNVEDFLNGGLDPPDASSLVKSKQFLKQIGALHKSEVLTNLGKYLSYLPADLQSGKLLIYGCVFSCVEICLTLASLSSAGHPFLNSYDDRDAIKQAKFKFSKGQGDMIGSALAFSEYDRLRSLGYSTSKFVQQNYLSFTALKEIDSTRSQFLSVLKEIGFVPFSYSSLSSNLNENNENYHLICSIIAGSLYPNIARVQLPDPKYFQSSAGAVEKDPDLKQAKLWIRNEDYNQKILNNEDRGETLPASRAFIHPSSLLFGESQKLAYPDLDAFTKEDGSLDMEKVLADYKVDFTPQLLKGNNPLKQSFVAYASSSQTSKLFLRDLTPVNTLAALLFGGEINYDMSDYVVAGRTSPGIIMDNWMPVRTWCKNGVLVKRLKVLLDQVIEDKLSDPFSRANDDIFKIVDQLLHTEK